MGRATTRVFPGLAAFLLVSGALCGCARAWFPFDRHPIPSVTVDEAKASRDAYCRDQGLDTAAYFPRPVFLDSSYVFYSRHATLEKAAAEDGIWVHIRTGAAGRFPKK